MPSSNINLRRSPDPNFSASHFHPVTANLRPIASSTTCNSQHTSNSTRHSTHAQHPDNASPPMPSHILMVAEKPSIARSVAASLSPPGTAPTTTPIPGNPYVKNYAFPYTFPPPSPWGATPVIMTSVLGHLTACEFTGRYTNWSTSTPHELFDAPVETFIPADKRAIAENLRRQARGARGLLLWTDCDREGEAIGAEIRDVVRAANPGCAVRRARFSNVERVAVLAAAAAPGALDERQVAAVGARTELDLRIGASFTRWQTRVVQGLGGACGELRVVSFGPCQIPTLGFVVARYWRVRRFVAEAFWRIGVWEARGGMRVGFVWRRGHLFDRMVVTVLFERCVRAEKARVTQVGQKPASKWRPLPLTTVELQKCGSRFLRMDSQRVMEVAEKLYNAGLISYPRTETDSFDAAMDLKALVQRQVGHRQWGTYAQALLDGDFRTPRAGRNNDQAHPPIHPVGSAPERFESDDFARVYEFVTRRFLACCSDDAKGESNTVQLTWAGEIFTASGLLVLARNYLDVYPYDRWESSQQLPKFEMGEEFRPSEAKMDQGTTTKPGYLTEPELIALMDANGIGTDATMAEHIAKIKEREYVTVLQRAAGGDGRGGTSGRGRGRGGRGGAAGARGTGGGGGGGGTGEFIPTTLGVALITGYDNMELEYSLGKPFLRKEMELKMKAICEGRTQKSDVVHESVEMYRGVFVTMGRKTDVLKASVRRYVLNMGGDGA